MELPKNGGIVIIDDQMEEALPLMNALSSKGVAYSYYDGQPRNYPKEPLTNIRLVFLDMHLDEAATSSNSSRNIISTLIGGLDAVIDENNGPYAILVWSKHDSQHLDEFIKEIMEKKALSCSPIAVLNLEKTKCFNRIAEGNTGWTIKPDGLEIIEESLEEQLNSVDAFTVLYGWENAIRESSGKTLTSISNVFNENSFIWNTNLKSCFYRVARAYAGNNLILKDDNILKNAFYAMNMIVDDFNCLEVEREIELLQKIKILQHQPSQEDIVLFADNHDEKLYYVTLSEDGKKFKIFEGKDNICIREASELSKLLKPKGEIQEVQTSLKDINISSIGRVNTLLNIRTYLLDQYRPGNIYTASEELKDEICHRLKFSADECYKMQGIELEMSPLCDFAQAKRQRLRILPGLIIPYDIDISHLKNAKYTYISNVFYVDAKYIRLLFDFRYFKSEKMDYLVDKNEAIFALRDEILQTIVDDFSMHASRSGFVYME